jgi:PEP-CTERM motif
MNMFFKTVTFALPIVATVFVAPAHAANLITNGDFSGGTYTSTVGGNTSNMDPNGWTPNAGFNLNPGYNHPTFVNGLSALSIGNYDFQPLATLSQTFSDLSGSSYTVNFSAYDGGANGGDPNAYLQVSAGGQSVTLNDTVAGPFQPYNFTFTGAGSDSLSISAQTNPSEWYVTNVSVNGAVAAVPEPETYAMLLAGLGLIGFIAYRRKNDSSGMPMAA